MVIKTFLTHENNEKNLIEIKFYLNRYTFWFIKSEKIQIKDNPVQYFEIKNFFFLFISYN